MRHYDLSPLTRNHRAWDNDRYYRRDADDTPTAEERGEWVDCGRCGSEYNAATDDTCDVCGFDPRNECPCGSGLPVDADGGCVVCWFERTEPQA